MRKLEETLSICPICHKPVKAAYIEEDKQVFMTKTCVEHGTFKSKVAASVEDYTAWIAHPMTDVPPRKTITEGIIGQCPLDCGICENHLQTACCVLIDVTERCNQQCPYCFAKAEEDVCSEPSLDEIERKYNLLLELGEAERTYNIHLSGGEPTIRDDLPQIIKMGREKGFEYIQINTNGRRLAYDDKYAAILKQAGASVIYLQFDGTEDKIFEALRGEPLFEIKKKAIDNCKKARIPVVLVPTIVKNENLNNIGDMVDFLLENLSVVKGIHFQPVSFFGRHPEKACKEGQQWVDYENRVTMFDIMHELQKQTEGQFKYDNFSPSAIGHTLCSFHGTFRKQKDGTIKCLNDHDSKASSNCCNPASDMEVIKKNRDYVLNKWNLSEQEESNGCCDACSDEEHTGSCNESEVMTFDQFIAEMKNSMFTVSGMAFQDISNLDAQRLKRCRVQVLAPDNRLIPFCAYNSLYRL